MDIYCLSLLTINIQVLAMKFKFVESTNFTTVEDINLHLHLSEPAYAGLVTYHSIATIFGLLGNMVVLIGSLKFHAIAVDKISTLLVEALAILDILIVVTYSVPVWVTLILRRWVLGAVICYIQGFAGFSCCMIEMTVIQGVSIYRFYALSHPLSARTLTCRLARRIILGITVFIASYMLCIHFMGQYWFFSPNLLSCQPSGITDPRTYMVVYTGVATVLTMVLPLTTTILANIGILVCVTKSNSQRQKREMKQCAYKADDKEHKINLRRNLPGKKAIITVSCIAWAFVISVTPMTIRILLQISQVSMDSCFKVISIEALFINSISNPLIYTITNQRFRNFMCKICGELLHVLRTGRRNSESFSSSWAQSHKIVDSRQRLTRMNLSRSASSRTQESQANTPLTPLAESKEMRTPLGLTPEQ